MLNREDYCINYLGAMSPEAEQAARIEAAEWRKKNGRKY